jgi:UDP-N-acetylglucosamine:LPS N-acetylglucosamine transferase
MLKKKKKILAIASSGGHWIQLLRLRPAYNGHDVVYASTNRSYFSDVENHEFHAIIDAHRKSLPNFFVMIFQLFHLIRKTKPAIIITTGAAPGLMALIIGRLFATKNVWIDSIANVEKISTSGKYARYVADLYLTQWEDLAKSKGPEYKGSIL